MNTSNPKFPDISQSEHGTFLSRRSSAGAETEVPTNTSKIQNPKSKIPRARAIRKPGVMNKTEAAYAAHLEQRRQAGEILAYHFEAYTLKLADNCRYTPDFMVVLHDGTMQFHEVKGYWMDDAKVKIKVAARLFPHIFLAVRKIKGGWETTDFTDNY